MTELNSRDGKSSDEKKKFGANKIYQQLGL